MALKKFKKIPVIERESVLGALRGALEKRPDVLFAYVHGSFAQGEDFNDIDVALYLSKVPGSVLKYETSLETECGDMIRKYPVDVRVLNAAPLSFRYRVIKEGALLIVRDDDRRAGFQEATMADYFDFAPYRALYLKEALGLGA